MKKTIAPQDDEDEDEDDDDEDQNFCDRHADLFFFLMIIIFAPLSGIALVAIARKLVHWFLAN